MSGHRKWSDLKAESLIQRISERRSDTEFMGRLQKLIDENREALTILGGCETSARGSNSPATDAPSGTPRVANPDGAGRDEGAGQPAKKDQSGPLPQVPDQLHAAQAELRGRRKELDKLYAVLNKTRSDRDRFRDALTRISRMPEKEDAAFYGPEYAFGADACAQVARDVLEDQRA
ncbi:MAG TPA: hypothetical protein VEA41_09265 [Salinarimonas sp.]|nr:hypothetical protein [Salinarimonas sp.]